MERIALHEVLFRAGSGEPIKITFSIMLKALLRASSWRVRCTNLDDSEYAIRVTGRSPFVSNDLSG
jgi:hypothetical protein